MARSINLLDTLCIIVYFLILLGMALYHSRKIRRQDDVFLAGRSMSRWPIAISMYMALFSTNTFLGYTGWVNRPNGTVWIGLQTIGIMLAVPAVIALFPELYFRLRLTSVYEYLDKRFNQAVRTVATVFFLLSRMMWLSTMLYSASLVLSMMFGWTEANDLQNGQLWSILAIGVLATIFALLGGMHTVIWADVMQFGVLMTAIISMLVVGTRLSGGMGEVIRIGRESGRFDPPQAFSLTDDLSIASGLLLGFIGMLASCGADQVLLQQYLTAKNEREAKASLWRNGLLLKPVSLIYPFMGLIMYAYYHTHPAIAQLKRIPDDALPVFVLNVLPTGLRGLMISAIIAAVFTSVQSGLAAISAAAQVTYVKYRSGRALSDRQSVLLARTLLLITGVCVIAIACWVRALGEGNSVIQILNIVMYPFAGVLLGIFLLGILSQRANATGALVGGVAGFIGTIAFPLAKVLLPASLNSPSVQYLIHVSNFFYGLIGTFLTLAAGYAVSLLTAPPAEFRIKGLTRWSLPPAEDAELAATVEVK